MAIITKELAIAIAKKLGAVIQDAGAHKRAYVYHGGQLICHFGIRHSPKKDAGHDHVSGDIYFSSGKARRLGQCTITSEQWIADLQSRGLIPPDPGSPPEESATI